MAWWAKKDRSDELKEALRLVEELKAMLRAQAADIGRVTGYNDNLIAERDAARRALQDHLADHAGQKLAMGREVDRLRGEVAGLEEKLKSLELQNQNVATACLRLATELWQTRRGQPPARPWNAC